MKKQSSSPEQVSQKEREILLSLLQECLRLPGDIVELGCFKGETSVLFAKTIVGAGNINKKLYLYDSFAGLPQKSMQDKSVAGDAFREGELFVSKREVIERFRRTNIFWPSSQPFRPIIKKAFFSELKPQDLPEQICFGFFDGDLYNSIRTSLNLVENLVSPGGVLVVHDYNNPELPGVSQAVDEWLQKNNKIKLTRRETLAILTGFC